ncbi:MAG: histidine triad nucleotide-binding protein [Coriobacteriales bacterium]|nr:histidine triad nucleotide-binding protein [Coriobacteriales bacterium]
MDDCIFCKIANGEIPSTFLYEDDLVCAFRDLNPQAPTHVLVVPKAHYANIVDGVPAETLAAMVKAVDSVATQEGIRDTGFRVIANTGKDAGQTVHHLHWHVIGGTNMGERLA